MAFDEKSHEKGYDDAMQEIAGIFNQDDGGRTHYQIICGILGDIESHLLNEAGVDIGATSWDGMKSCPICGEPTIHEGDAEAEYEIVPTGAEDEFYLQNTDKILTHFNGNQKELSEFYHKSINALNVAVD